MSAVADCLEPVTALVPHLRWRRAGSEAYLTGAELVADAGRRDRELSGSGPARGSDDPQVLASLWWQSYAYRVAGTTLAAWVLSGAAPDPSLAAGTGVWVARGRPSGVVYGAQAEAVAGAEILLQRLMAGHLDPWAQALTHGRRLGRRLVWGNAAAGVAAALAAVATAPGAPDLGDRMEHIWARLPHGMGELGQWEQGWNYRRRNCCLWWKTTVADGALCEDCSRR